MKQFFTLLRAYGALNSKSCEQHPFFDDVSNPLGYRLREAWLVQFPRRAGLIFYFCQEDEEYERLLMAGPESGHFL